MRTVKVLQTLHELAQTLTGCTSVRLLGHLYVRYFDDLFGGRALGAPTRIALHLPTTPQFYTWDAKVEANRRDYIERIYQELNAAGDAMGEAQQVRVVDEARAAFAHNAAIYTEQVGEGGEGVGWGWR